MSSDSISTLEFPSAPLLLRHCPPQPPSYVLTATTDAAAPSGMSYVVTSVVECITKRENGMRQVFRVKLTSEAFQEPRHFICKTALGRQWYKSLAEEAMLYERKLKPLWGKVVPHYYGFFSGETYEGKTGIILLEDCGQLASDWLSRQPTYLRKSVLEAFIALHRAGVSFQQDSTLAAQVNVVIQYDPASAKYVPRLIDFSAVYPNHECLSEYGDIVVGAPEPEPSEVMCPSLYGIFLASALFTPTHIRLRCGKDLPWEYATDAETLKAHITFPDDMSESDVECDIAAALRERAQWDQEREECDDGPVRVSEETS
ncbi:hypothetical protein PYCCODRAFT_1434134 [Trametes coccinea BRFM310]|uniref:Protein kinase domain-containing protein n=1 Tax=Trametes coccinea (strain BRFM310) TaxID=1353009 RepID=A0A1Y2IRN5_TRAC3|nr:hypothetical protein PYCCODRAFT_1434134 [Trametes coccinea BRFM310]